jgi:CBS domain containing-hemolysin-like protein
MTVWYLLLAVALLVANGFFVGTEFALTAARRTKIEPLAEKGDTRARLALRSMNELSFVFAGSQLGITMASLALGHVAEPAVAELIRSAVGQALPAGVTHSVSLAAALMLLVYLHTVIGEMAPKNIAISVPERAALWVAVPFRLYAALLRPFIGLLYLLGSAASRLIGLGPLQERTTVHTAEEIGTMIHESAREGMIDRFGQKLLAGAIVLRERDAGEAMIPRTEVTAVSFGSTPADVERLVVKTGHSRFPVYRDNIDQVVGFVHAKDLLKVKEQDRDRPFGPSLIRPMLVVPESRKLYPLLLDMRRERKHFALVIDEHGGTAGIVTLEDVLEELVGEIRDEYDFAELDVEAVGGGRYLVPGTLRIDEAEERLGVQLPPGEYETVAGFLMEHLGRIPKRGDTIVHGSWRLRVYSMRKRRVERVLVEAALESAAGTEADAG